MIDDDDREGAQMDADIIQALCERAGALGEAWKFQGAILVLTQMLSSETQDTDDEQRFAGAREILGTILTLMLYLDKMPTEDEIEADVAKFRDILDRVDKGPNEEEDPLS